MIRIPTANETKWNEIDKNISIYAIPLNDIPAYICIGDVLKRWNAYIDGHAIVLS